jgi:hypothetical protein
MFEIDVTAHFISQQPIERAQRFIDFHDVLRYNHMLAVKQHRSSSKPSWNESLNFLWEQEYAENESQIVENFERVKMSFMQEGQNRKTKAIRNWSGLTLKEMARAVDHVEAYDVFYSDLSSYTHADVHLADSFLKIGDSDRSWSMKAHEGDFAFVVQYALSFFECFLTLFGSQFNTWKPSDVSACWALPGSN